MAVVFAWAHGKQTVISEIPPITVSGFVGWANPVQNVVIDDSTNNNESLRSGQNVRFLWASSKHHSNRHCADRHGWAFAGKDKSFIGFCPVLIQRRLSQSVNQFDLKPTTGTHNFRRSATVIGGLESPFSGADLYRNNVNPRAFGVDKGFRIERGCLSKFVKMIGVVFQDAQGFYSNRRSNNPNNCEGDGAYQNKPIEAILSRCDAYFRGERSDLHFVVLALICLPGGFLVGGLGGDSLRVGETLRSCSVWEFVGA